MIIIQYLQFWKVPAFQMHHFFCRILVTEIQQWPIRCSWWMFWSNKNRPHLQYETLIGWFAAPLKETFPLPLGPWPATSKNKLVRSPPKYFTLWQLIILSYYKKCWHLIMLFILFYLVISSIQTHINTSNLRQIFVGCFPNFSCNSTFRSNLLTILL